MWSCSIQARSPQRDTATEATRSRHRGRAPHEQMIMQPKGACGEPDASTRRTSGSEGGPGKRTGGNVDTAPRADPYHLKVRLEQTKLCLLVMIGVRADGRKELVALTDGYRESTESWADLLRCCRRRGMRAPVLAVGDGALGFWAALREVFPDTREQRCWFHKQANVLAALPKSAHPGALAALKDIYNAEDIDKAQVAAKAFELDYGAKYPKAVTKITEDLDTLLEFYKYPAEHWIHLRTTNPIESTFATVRLRQRVTKGPGSRAAGIAMAFKLIESAQARWRAVNAPHLVARVRAGARVEKDKLFERPDELGRDQQVVA